MLKRFKNRCWSLVASIITVAAFTGISPNSLWTIYEPEIPESLKNTSEI